MQNLKVKINVNELFEVVEKFLKSVKKSKTANEWVHITLNNEGFYFSIDNIKEGLNIERLKGYDMLLIERIEKVKKLLKYLKDLKKYNIENAYLEIKSGTWYITID
jgi:hypothetical protein